MKKETLLPFTLGFKSSCREYLVLELLLFNITTAIVTAIPTITTAPTTQPITTGRL